MGMGLGLGMGLRRALGVGLALALWMGLGLGRGRGTWARMLLYRKLMGSLKTKWSHWRAGLRAAGHSGPSWGRQGEWGKEQVAIKRKKKLWWGGPFKAGRYERAVKGRRVWKWV